MSLSSVPVACKCRASRCLKRYCVCFEAGASCGPQCRCVECANDDGLCARRKRPLRSSKPSFCQCTKSKCLKRYCECFAAGRHCSLDCNCLDCKNRKKTDEDDEVRAIFLHKREAAAQEDKPRQGSPTSVVDPVLFVRFGPVGVLLEERTRGLISVVSAQRGSPAEKAGIAPGDKLDEINGLIVTPSLSFGDCLKLCAVRPLLIKFSR